LLFTKIIVQLNRNKILNLLQSDYKYPTDFGFPEKCRIPSDSDADLESVTSLTISITRMLSSGGEGSYNSATAHSNVKLSAEVPVWAEVISRSRSRISVASANMWNSVKCGSLHT